MSLLGDFVQFYFHRPGVRKRHVMCSKRPCSKACVRAPALVLSGYPLRCASRTMRVVLTISLMLHGPDFSPPRRCRCVSRPQGVLSLYTVSAGWMMAFVLFLRALGGAGNGVRGLLPTPRPVMRLLRSRSVCAATALGAVVASHVETFSLPPTFREITLKGELFGKCTFMLILCC